MQASIGYQESMQHYPLFVNLAGRHCLVVGAGSVGKRKAHSLLLSGAEQVTVIDTHPASSEWDAFFAAKGTAYYCRNFDEKDIDGKFLVFACTSDQRVNSRISELCKKRGILCNNADSPEAGSFIVPASINQGDLTIAVSTSGHSPALSKRIRKELQDYFGSEYDKLLQIMGRLRPLLLKLDMGTSQNTAVFRALVYSELLDALKMEQLDVARKILEQSLPQSLHVNIPELLDGLV